MKIYIVHSTNFDYKNELYRPFKNSEIGEAHDLYFPHEEDYFENTKSLIKNVDLIIAEVSLPSTGMGIELGWAESIKKRVICIYKKGSKLSSALKVVSREFFEYENTEDLANRLIIELSKIIK